MVPYILNEKFTVLNEKEVGVREAIHDMTADSALCVLLVRLMLARNV